MNLPAAKKWAPPAYQDIRASGVKLAASPDGGALVRVIAGEIGGQKGPGTTQTPIAMAHVTLQPGAQVRLPWDPGFNALVYVLSGSGTVGAEKRPVRQGQLVVHGPGDVITVAAAAEPAEGRTPELDVVVLGGTPIGEPVAQYGPFVMNTRAELQQAFDDFQAGRMGQIPG